MPDYEPLDLAEKLNAGLDILDSDVAAAIGFQSFRGLPFLINDDPSKCFIALDKEGGAIEIPVGKPASHIIFAHRLLHSDIDDGGPVGNIIADYSFCQEGGKQVEYTI